MTHIRLNDSGELLVGALDAAGASPQEWARFAHLKTPEARFAVVLAIRAGVPVGEAIDCCQRTERRLDRTDDPR